MLAIGASLTARRRALTRRVVSSPRVRPRRCCPPPSPSSTPTTLSSPATYPGRCRSCSFESARASRRPPASPSSSAGYRRRRCSRAPRRRSERFRLARSSSSTSSGRPHLTSRRGALPASRSEAWEAARRSRPCQRLHAPPSAPMRSRCARRGKRIAASTERLPTKRLVPSRRRAPRRTRPRASPSPRPRRSAPSMRSSPTGASSVPRAASRAALRSARADPRTACALMRCVRAVRAPAARRPRAWQQLA